MKRISLLCAFLLLAASTLAQIQTATLGESNAKTPEVSTDAIVKEAFHNVAFFEGTYAELSNATK